MRLERLGQALSIFRPAPRAPAPLSAADVVASIPDLSGAQQAPLSPSVSLPGASLALPSSIDAAVSPDVALPSAVSLPAAARSAAIPATSASPSAPRAAANLSSARDARPSPQSVVAGIEKRVASLGAAFFDGPSVFARGIMRAEKHAELDLPEGVRVTAKPRPVAGQTGPVALARFHLSPEHVLADGSRPITLEADASDTASVEKALRALVDADPSQFGAASADMATVHVERLAGRGKQADSIIAVFRQVKKGKDLNGKPYLLAVEGANLRFHIKVLGGKPVVMAIEGGFVPKIDPAIMTVRYTDEQLNDIATGQLQPRARASAGDESDAPQLSFLTRQITFIDGGWHAANVYQGSDLKGAPVIVVVDVNTGHAYVVNADDIRYRGFPGRGKTPTANENGGAAPSGPAPRAGLESAGADSGEAITGVALARGTGLTADGQDHGPSSPVPLINAYVYDANGRVVATTDAQGRFTIPASVNGGAPMQVTVKLSGVYGDVFDEDKNDSPIAATLTATPGRPVTLTLNATGDDEQLEADVNGYLYPYGMIEWLRDTLGLGGDARFFQPLKNGIHANGTQMVANAFYDPVTDAFYLMKRGTLTVPAGRSSDDGVRRGIALLTKVPRKGGRARTITLTAENTAQPSIELHEFGHRQFQVASQLRLSAEQAADPAYRFVKWLLDPIVASDSNEAGADTFSMFIRNSPVIGNGFFVSATPASALPRPDIIRTGENATPYDDSGNAQDDPHRQGESQMGPAWKTRADLIAEMGPAEGALYAALLFVRTWLYIQPGSVPSALMHALIADMAQDGSIPHAEMIRAHAQDDHGLTLPAPPAPGAA